MSDANRTSVRYVPEVTFGTTPATPAFKAMRITAATLDASIQTAESQELIANRRIRDVIRTAFQPSGSVPVEFSYGLLDDFIEAAIQGTWSNKSLKYNNGVADSEITDANATTDAFTTTAVSPAWVLGMLVRSSGFTNAGNNQLFRAQAGSTSTSLVAPASPGLVNETTPPGTARLKCVGVEGASGDMTATTGPNTLTISATTGDWTTYGLAVGQWVKIGGTAAGTQFNTTVNNGACRISAITATVLTFDIVPSGWAADTGTGKTIQVWIGDVLRDPSLPANIVARSYTIEEEFSDLTTPEFHYWTGFRVDTLELNAQAEAILTASISFQGKGSNIQTTRFAGATTVAAPTGEVFNAGDDVARIGADGSSVVGGVNPVSGFTMTINNNMRRRPQIGAIESANIGSGRLRVEGQLNTYYGSKDVLDKLRAGQTSSIDTLWEKNGQGILIDLPRVKFTAGTPEVPGVDQDRRFNPSFLALEHPTLDYTINVQRFEEIVV